VAFPSFLRALNSRNYRLFQATQKIFSRSGFSPLSFPSVVDSAHE